MRAVNLLPRDDVKRRTPKAALPVLVAGALPILIVAALAAFYSMESGKVASKQEQLDQVQAELERTPAPAPIDPVNTAIAREKQNRITAVSGVLGSRVAFDSVLRELSLVLPEDVWLSSLTARSAESQLMATPGAAPAAPAPSDGGAAAPASAAPAAPAPSVGAEEAGFVLVGFTYSQEGVARLLSRLAVLPHLKNVRLSQSLRVAAVSRPVVQFTIAADLRTPKESS